MNKCPKCGGTSGFGYNLMIVTERAGVWGKDEDEEVTIKYTNNPKTVKCMDCGARIDSNLAHGVENSRSKTYAR